MSLYFGNWFDNRGPLSNKTAGRGWMVDDVADNGGSSLPRIVRLHADGCMNLLYDGEGVDGLFEIGSASGTKNFGSVSIPGPLPDRRFPAA
jgi:hypothetical protein